MKLDQVSGFYSVKAHKADSLVHCTVSPHVKKIRRKSDYNRLRGPPPLEKSIFRKNIEIELLV
jgi:hypothetical protein